jgi:KTSC domain
VAGYRGKPAEHVGLRGVGLIALAKGRRVATSLPHRTNPQSSFSTAGLLEPINNAAMARVWLIVLIASLDAPSLICRAEPSPTLNSITSHISRQEVQSSAIAKIGYSKRRHILEIEFANGAVYRYFDVPLSVYRDLMSAESKARFYDSYIRKHYRSALVRQRQNHKPPGKSPAAAEGSDAAAHE